MHGGNDFDEEIEELKVKIYQLESALLDQDSIIKEIDILTSCIIDVSDDHVSVERFANNILNLIKGE